MSGHSKWAQIKRKKAATDSARGKVFTKIIKEITVAARLGGGDPEGNPRLRLAIQNAKSNNMPQDNIVRAVKKGTGELEGVRYEEITYEGYGPGGIALVIECLTDNRNRTVADLRHIMSRGGGNLAESGSVIWNFERKGVINLLKGNYSEDDLLSEILDAGAEDLVSEEEFYQITMPVENFETVRRTVESSSLRDIKIDNASLQYLARNTVKLDNREAEQAIKLISALEDNDDVQNVYTNADIDEKIMASVGA